MSLYEELKTINKSIRREVLDMADFKTLLSNLLKKYKACENCQLYEHINKFKKGGNE